MDLEDAITIATPEGVELRVVLAGPASRSIGGTLDIIFQLLLTVLAALVMLALIGGGIGEALFFMAFFAIVFLYHILFELLGSGRTPGKRLTHLRVVRENGASVDLPASAIRTLMRLIDFLPNVYLVGLFSIVVTRKNQRLGDLAAGTLVIRELAAAPAARVPAETAAASSPGAAGRMDASAVTPEEMAAVHRFLARRHGLDAAARRALAYRLEQGLRPKVAGAQPAGEPEQFLEALAQVKSGA